MIVIPALQMMNRDFSNGNQGSSSDWNSQDGPDIGVWNPVSVNPRTTRQTAQEDTGSSGWNTTSQHHVDINSDWRVPAASNYDPYSAQQYSTNAVPGDMYQQQFMNNSAPPAQTSTAAFGQYGPPGFENMMGNHRPMHDPYTSQYPGNLNSVTNGSLLQSANYRPTAQPDNWSLSMTVPNSDTSERVVTVSNPGNFINPLLDSSADSVTDSANLLHNLKLEKQKFDRLIANKPRMPSHIPQSSLMMLQKQLVEAAEPFSSPEAFKIARERELGLHSIDDVRTNVIVSNLSAQAANFVPRSRSSRLQAQVKENASEQEAADVVASLAKLIESVLTQPGNFGNLSAVFINQVRLRKHSDKTVKEMVDMIFNKAISEDNFKYLGARLCDELTTPDVLNNFRSNFLNQMQTEFKKVSELFDTAENENVERIHGFVTFMAEVFIHIKINGQPIIALGKSLGRFLENLLTKPNNNVTFVCKMLKLAGAKLYDALSKNEENKKIYDATFRELKSYSYKQTDVKEEKAKRMMQLITSVLRLKDSNWGRTYSNTRKNSSISDPAEYGDQLSELDPNYFMNEPVFFTPDGVQYTAAEAQIPEFYDQHLAKFNVKQDVSSEEVVSFPWNPKDKYFDDYIPSDQEEELLEQNVGDSEYDDEFEKFLAESGQLQ